jgi:hypothetical protein
MDDKRLGRILDKAMRCEGQTTRSECGVLATLAANVPVGQVIVEIGSYRGRSTIALALGSLAGNGGRVYAIDPHTIFVGAKGGQFGPKDMAALYNNIVRFEVGETVAVVCMGAYETALGWWQGANVGLWVHDGDHRYAAVYRDLSEWLQYVAKDGIVAFHDRTYPGMKRLLNELSGLECYKCFEVLGVERELAWFRKRAR